jgi:hypothetical protein
LEGEETRIGKNKKVGLEGKKGHVGRKGVRTDYRIKAEWVKKQKFTPRDMVLGLDGALVSAGSFRPLSTI